MSSIWCQGGWFWMRRESTKLARGRRGGRSVCTRRVEFLGHAWNCLPFFWAKYFLQTQPLLVVGWWQVCGGLSEVVARSGEGVTTAIILSECEDQRLWGCENYIVSVFSLLIMCNMRSGTVYFAEHTSTQMPRVTWSKESYGLGNPPLNEMRGEKQSSQDLYLDELSFWNYVIPLSTLHSMWHENWCLIVPGYSAGGYNLVVQLPIRTPEAPVDAVWLTQTNKRDMVSSASKWSCGPYAYPFLSWSPVPAMILLFACHRWGLLTMYHMSKNSNFC